MEITTKSNTRRKERMTYDTAFTLNGKTPPRAVEVEEAVLGALMLDSNALTNTIETIQQEYFYKIENQLIFGAIRTLFEKGKQVDILTVTQQLISDGKLEEVGGTYYISQLTNRVISAAHIENHAHILAEKYIQRELIRIGTETIKESYDETNDVLELLDRTEQHLLDVSDKNLHSDYHQIGDLMKEAKDQIENAQNKDEGLVGVPTGYVGLDRLTAGLQPGTLNIIAARPAMGKTAFALSVARNMAVDFKKPVAFFSLEMTAVELVMRLIASESGISSEHLKRGDKLENWEKEKLRIKMESLKEAPIYIDDTPQLSVFELRAKCRRLKQRYNISAVFIDYLQLMQTTTETNRNSNREQEISMISRQLKALSKELSIPVVALSQLSREVEKRPGDKRPQLSDLRESGAIEQDADIVAFIYRPEYYGLTDPDEKGPVLGMADIIIAKHRSGSTDTVRLRFIKSFTRFEDVEQSVSNGLGGMSANAGFDDNGVKIIQSSMNQNNSNSGDTQSPFDAGNNPSIQDDNNDVPF